MKRTRGGLLMIVMIAGLLPLPAWSAATFDHSAWDAILKQHVDQDGRVAYRNLAEKDRKSLDGYLARLAGADPGSMSREEQLAFWINAYNAVIVSGVLDGYHAESTFGRYRFFKSLTRRIAGKDRTPDEIEHRLVRPVFKDFRSHFALNCASGSCPKLRAEAYVGERLDAQLDDQARVFLHDSSRNQFDREQGQVSLSRIFDWFAADFTAGGRTLAQAISPYLSPADAQLLEKADIDYLEYDWTMNAQPGQRP